MCIERVDERGVCIERRGAATGCRSSHRWRRLSKEKEKGKEEAEEEEAEEEEARAVECSRGMPRPLPAYHDKA